MSGRVTYDDGAPIPAGIRLHFAAQDAPQVEGAFPRPGIAEVNENGEFECVTSYKYCDGLVPGRHKVAIQAMSKEGRSLVPQEYTNVATTPLIVDTKDSPLEIKVPKPQPRRQR